MLGFRRASALGLIAGLILSLLVPIGTMAAPPKSKLDKHDRALLAEARAQGDATVTLLIATAPGGTKQVADAIAAQGGTIRYRDNDLGYIRAVVPRAKAESAAAVDGIQAVDLDEIIPLDDPRPQGSGRPDAADPARVPRTPRNNPYMPIGDTGAAAVPRRPPDVGRPRRHGRHPRLRDHARPPGAARRPRTGEREDRRLGHLHRSDLRRQRRDTTTTRPGSRCTHR